MDCAEFRERCQIEPNSADPELQAHRQQCPECAAEAERLRGFDAVLRAAAAVEVPDGLADRILARQAIAERAVAESTVVPFRRPARRTGRSLRRPWYAVAASVLLAIGLVSGGYYLHQITTPLPEAVMVALKDTMPGYDRMVADGDIDPNIERNLHDLLRVVGARMVGDPGRIYYCETTRIDDRITAIMVFPGKMGAVTVIYVKGKRVAARDRIQGDHMQGVIWPEKRGSVAIVGHRGEPMIEDIEQRVRRTMVWF